MYVYFDSMRMNEWYVCMHILHICRGLDKIGWEDVPIIACETEGANSFAQTHAAQELRTIPAITSIAKSLGALTVAEV